VKRFVPDTSCLVAALCSWHEQHAATREDLASRSRRREELVLVAPALVEAYAVLTRLPAPFRLRSADALSLLQANWMGADVVALPGADCWDFLGDCDRRGVAGGRTYDALVAACARRAGARLILTWNLRDFERVTEEIEVVSPRPR
jgi:predicted nucleic acid-binding protein